MKSETDPPPTQVTLRLAALVGLAGLAMLVHRMATATLNVGPGLGGRVLARLDIGVPLLIAGAAFLIKQWVSDPLSRLRRAATTLSILVISWWITMVASAAALHPQRSAKEMLSTATLFRLPFERTPVLGSTIGVALNVVALSAVAAVVVRWSPRLLGLLFATGWVIRLGLLAFGQRSAFGWYGTFPALLDLVAIGFAVATVPQVRAIPRRVCAMGALVTAAGSLLLDPVVQSSGLQLALRSLLQSACVGLLLVWVSKASPPSALRPLLLVSAIAGSGWVLFGEAAVVLVARQYRERLTELPNQFTLAGSGLMPTIWATILAGSFGVALFAAIVLPTYRLLRGNWPQWSYALSTAGLVATSFLWRVFAMLTIAPERTDGGDPLFYHTTANLLARGRGFSEPLNWIAYGKQIPSAVHGPLYPVVLSISSRLGGTTYFDHKVLSCIIGAGLVFVVGLVTRKIGGRGAALLAMVFAGAYPNLWIIDGVLFPEGLTALLTTLAVWMGYRWREHPTRAWAIGIGVVVGLAVLTRGEAISLLVLFVAPWMLRHTPVPRRQQIRHLLITGVTCAVMLVPWTIRNMMVFEEFVPLSTNSNDLLTYANCDETYSGKFLGFWLYDCQDQIRLEVGEPPGDESQKAVFWRKNGLSYLRDHIDELPKVIAARIGRQWELFRPLQNTEFAPIEGRNRRAAEWGLAMYYGLAVASVGGLMQLRRRSVSVIPYAAILLNVTATAALAYGTTRFRAPGEPVLCILAGVGAVPVIHRLRRRWAARENVPISDDKTYALGGPSWVQHMRQRRSTGRLRWQAAAGWVAVGLALVAPLRGLYRATGSTMEEGFMLTFPERVLAGDVPNVDFLHLYGPGSLYILAGWYKILGVTLEAERTFGLLQEVGIIAAVWTISRVWGRLAAVLCACFSIVFVLTPIGLQALAWSGAVALGLWSVITGMRARNAISTIAARRSVLLSGALGGFTLTFRPDLGLALAMAHGFLLWRTRRWRRFAIGAAIGLLPMWIHLIRAGPVAAFRGMIIDPIFHLRAGRELPRPPSWDRMDGALQNIGEKFPPWWGLPAISPSQQLALWFFALPIVALGLLAIAVVAKRRSQGAPRTILLVAVALFAVGLLPQAFQRPDSAHFLWVACVSWPLAPIGLIELWHLRAPRTHVTVRTTVCVAAISALTLLVAPFYTYRTYIANVRQSIGSLPTGLPITRGERTFYLGDLRPQRAAQQVIDELSTLAKPGERLLSGPVDLRSTVYSDVVFYYMFPELTPATYFIEMDPGLANEEGSRLASDVASSDWLILNRLWAGWIEPNDSIVFGSDTPNQVVEDNFCLVNSYENDLVRLYRKCAGGGAPGPYEAPYDPRYDYAVEVRVPVPPRPDGTCTPTCNGAEAPGVFGPP